MDTVTDNEAANDNQLVWPTVLRRHLGAGWLQLRRRRVWRNRLIYWLVTFVMCWGGNGALYLMGLNTVDNMLLGMAATAAVSVPIGFLMWRMPNK